MLYEFLFVDVSVSVIFKELSVVNSVETIASIEMFFELDSISVWNSVDKIPEFLTEFILGSVLDIFDSFISDDFSIISVESDINDSSGVLVE